jgi:hypothetical protein
MASRAPQFIPHGDILQRCVAEQVEQFGPAEPAGDLAGIAAEDEGLVFTKPADRDAHSDPTFLISVIGQGIASSFQTCQTTVQQQPHRLIDRGGGATGMTLLLGVERLARPVCGEMLQCGRPFH